MYHEKFVMKMYSTTGEVLQKKKKKKRKGSKLHETNQTDQLPWVIAERLIQISTNGLNVATWPMNLDHEPRKKPLSPQKESILFEDSP